MVESHQPLLEDPLPRIRGLVDQCCDSECRMFAFDETCDEEDGQTYVCSYTCPVHARIEEVLPGLFTCPTVLDEWKIGDRLPGHEWVRGSSGEIISHTRRRVRALFAWCEGGDLTDDFIAANWPVGGERRLNARAVLLPKEHFTPLLMPDPAWNAEFGGHMHPADLPEPSFTVRIRDGYAAHPGMDDLLRMFHDNVDPLSVWRDLEDVVGERLRLYAPLLIDVVPSEVIPVLGFVHTMVNHLTTSAPGKERVRLRGSLRSAPDSVVLGLQPNMPPWKLASLLGHELVHVIAPCYPDNELVTEGVAEIIEREIVYRRRGSCTDLQHLSKVDVQHCRILLGGTGFDCGIGEHYQEFGSGYDLLFHDAARTLLGDAFGWNPNALKELFAIMRSRSTDTESLEGFLADVEHRIPGFIQRFQEHPASQPITAGPMVAVLTYPSAVAVVAVSLHPNARYGEAREGYVPPSCFGYVSRRQDAQMFQRERGHATPLPCKLLCTTGRRSFAVTLVPTTDAMTLTAAHLAKWAEDSGIPKSEIAAPFTVHVAVREGESWRTLVPALTVPPYVADRA